MSAARGGGELWPAVGGEEEEHVVLDEEREVGAERRVDAIRERVKVVGERVDGAGRGADECAVRGRWSRERGIWSSVAVGATAAGACEDRDGENDSAHGAIANPSAAIAGDASPRGRRVGLRRGLADRAR